jgi:hydroxypyruvate reductase
MAQATASRRHLSPAPDAHARWNDEDAVNEPDARKLSLEIFQEVAAHVDGAALVRGATHGEEMAAATHVLAVGKVAFPMLAGARAGGQAGRTPRPTLAIAPAPRVPAQADIPAGVTVAPADHPIPTARSVAAGEAALAFVRALRPQDRLLVLLSGGASSLLCMPAPGLTLDDKRAATSAVSRGGAAIGALNAVRKHLSAIKGGRLALESRAPVTVLALSDVIGGEPATIGSGPFSPDPTTYADAIAAVVQTGAKIPDVARAHLERGMRGEIPESPKPGDPRLAHVAWTAIAGPERVPAEARRAAEARGLKTAVLSRDAEDDVDTLAAAYLDRATHEAAQADGPRVLIGNGEPTIKVGEGAGKGGRSTHLALAVARGLAALPPERRARVAFLAAGTDDRDGDTPVSGGLVDGTTWARIQAAGVDPQRALERWDSYTALAAVGDTVTGPGTSNLLDLHLLVVT